jgi:hypothetical protein
MLDQLAEKAPAHGRVHISDMVLHARKKNRNNFD